tara:strand:+ start:7226 stop:7351 length:126 start_codon:yes stop_codon:yes gene_type:complete
MRELFLTIGVLLTLPLMIAIIWANLFKTETRRQKKTKDRNK